MTIYKRAIDIAKERGYPEIVELLSKGPAQLSIRLVRERIELRKQLIETQKKLDELEYLAEINDIVSDVLNQS